MWCVGGSSRNFPMHDVNDFSSINSPMNNDKNNTKVKQLCAYSFYHDETIIITVWRHYGRHGVWKHQPHVVDSTIYSGADQRKHQSSASLAFVRGISRTKGQ